LSVSQYWVCMIVLNIMSLETGGNDVWCMMISWAV
jgi:hypothetical protein